MKKSFNVCHLQVELEKLNKASEEINRLEFELDVCYFMCCVLFFGVYRFLSVSAFMDAYCLIRCYVCMIIFHCYS